MHKIDLLYYSHIADGNAEAKSTEPCITRKFLEAAIISTHSWEK